MRLLWSRIGGAVALHASGQRQFSLSGSKATRTGRAAKPAVFGMDIAVVDVSSIKAWLRPYIELTPLIGSWSVFR